MPRPAPSARLDIHDRITQQIISQLETGVRPWTQPWTSGTSVSCPLSHDGTPYKGINVVLLWAEAAQRGFSHSTWMTFHQALAHGAHVRKGERGATVVYANRPARPEADEPVHEPERPIPFLKAYTVFNVDQIEGLPQIAEDETTPVLNPDDRIVGIDSFFAQCGADVRHGGGSAFYAPGPDYVGMPPFQAFQSADHYYATLSH